MNGKFMKIRRMLKFLAFKRDSILGIDITSTAVKILEISGKKENPIIENYGFELLPPHAMDGNTIKDIDGVSQCIKRVIERFPTVCTQAVLAVPDALIISKIIEVDKNLNGIELEELIVAEAYQYISYPIDEINFDFEILGPSAKNPHLSEILVVASRAENINQRIEAATRAGLNPKVIDVESFAIARAAQQVLTNLPASVQDKTIAIIDIGANYTHLSILQKRKLTYSREEKFGGQQLIDAIAEYYQISLEEAALAKDNGALPQNYEKELLEPFKEDILLQIKRTLQFFYSTNQVKAVDYILLAGGLAKLPLLEELVQVRLGVSASIANPLITLGLGTRVNRDCLHNEAPTLMVACGLALYGTN